jgi:hypothetical protein
MPRQKLTAAECQEETLAILKFDHLRGHLELAVQGGPNEVSAPLWGLDWQPLLPWELPQFSAAGS